MSFKKLLCAAVCVATCFTFTACDFGGVTDGGSGTANSADTSGAYGGEITDGNEVEIAEPDETEHDYALTEEADGTFTYKCADCGGEESVTVTCDSGTPAAYTVEGGTITFGNVTEKSVYVISGSFQGNIVIDAGEDGKFELQFNGFEISSHTACPVTVLSGDKVTLSAKKSTENYIYDMRGAVDSSDETSVSASVYALCDLDIQGKGSLNVKSVNNNGIHTKKDLSVKNLSLQVDCADNALKGNDGVTIESGNIVLIARRGDGIKTADSDVSSKGKQRGTVALSGGDVLIYAACDGIDAAYDVNIDESSTTLSLQIFTDKYSKYSEEVTAVAESVYYVRYNSSAYSYSLKFYNDGTDAVWYNSSTCTAVGNYRYYPITKASGYSYVQLYVYNNSQAQGQEESYLACTEGMSVNNNYDTIALQARGNALTYGWTNCTTSQNNSSFAGPGGMGGPGGNFGGMNEGNPDKGDYSTKGIKADNAVTVSAGTVTVSAYDDSIHANNDAVLESGASPSGNVTISGGNLTLRSNDDGIHADGKLSVTDGNISVVSSYEGLEGNTVALAGGTISVTSSDDGINGTAATGTAITVSGGTLYVYAGGDGLDSNSTASYSGIVFSGGRSVVISTGQADSSIDTERGYKYSGGYVVGIGNSGGMGGEATDCSAFSSVGTSKTIGLQKDGYLTVAGVVTVKMPVSINALVVCLGKSGASISLGTASSYSFDSDGVYWNV